MAPSYEFSLRALKSFLYLMRGVEFWFPCERIQKTLGGLLAVLGALYEEDVRTVAVRGGLVSFSSMLRSNFSYVPQDVIVPGILEVGDIPDIAAALAPRPLLLSHMVDGLDAWFRDQNSKQNFDQFMKRTKQCPPHQTCWRFTPGNRNQISLNGLSSTIAERRQVERLSYATLRC
jgi:hypothetical protein